MSCVPLWHASQSHRHQSAWDLLPGEWFRLEEGADMWPSLHFGKWASSWSVGRTFHIPQNRKGWETRKMCSWFLRQLRKKVKKKKKKHRSETCQKWEDGTNLKNEIDFFFFYHATITLCYIILTQCLQFSKNLKMRFNSDTDLNIRHSTDITELSLAYVSFLRWMNTDEYKQG